VEKKKFNNLRLYEKRYPDEAKIFFNEILPYIIEQALSYQNI